MASKIKVDSGRPLSQNKTSGFPVIGVPLNKWTIGGMILVVAFGGRELLLSVLDAIALISSAVTPVR